jgi:hypothetical protein
MKEPQTIDGLPVIDMKEPLVIHITEQDVRRGNTKDPGGCAAARACIREKHADAARVHVSRTYLKVGKEWHRYATPPSLTKQIIKFDVGGQFDPGDYRLTGIPKTKVLTGKRQGGLTAAQRSRKDKKKRKRHYNVVSGLRAHGANR